MFLYNDDENQLVIAKKHQLSRCFCTTKNVTRNVNTILNKATIAVPFWFHALSSVGPGDRLFPTVAITTTNCNRFGPIDTAVCC